jgi:hypothetical protein
MLKVDARLVATFRGSIEFLQDVYVLLLAEPNLESIKCMHVVELDVGFYSSA